MRVRVHVCMHAHVYVLSKGVEGTLISFIIAGGNCLYLLQEARGLFM